MQRRLSWLSKPLKDRIWVDREHVPLPRIAGEEDPRLDLEHLFTVGDGITLEISVVDKELVDVAAVDGAVDVKVVEHRHSRNLAYNATIVVNMDIMLINVLKEPVVPAAAEQHKVSISEVISLRHEEVHEELVVDKAETDEVMDAEELGFQVSMSCMTLKAMNTRLMMMETSSWIVTWTRMLLPRSKMIKARETERNQHRSCQWVCGSVLSIECWFPGSVE